MRSPTSSRSTQGRSKKKFYISGDLNVELGMMCTDREDAEELAEIYGPLCWHGHKHIKLCGVLL